MDATTLMYTLDRKLALRRRGRSPAEAHAPRPVIALASGDRFTILRASGDGLVLRTLVQTSREIPAQWEGLTDDGVSFYAWFRAGVLLVGLGATNDDAVDATIAAPFFEAIVNEGRTPLRWHPALSTADMLRIIGAVVRK